MNSVVIGREPEITEALGFLDEAAEHSAGLLLLGEAGVGKTTVWSAVVEAAHDRAFQVLVARPSEAEAELAFAVLTDLFAGVDDVALDELPAAQATALALALRRIEGGTPVDPTAVALAALGVLRSLSVSSPTIVAVDDLQWVDAPSLRALTFAYRRLVDARVGLAATVRTGFALELTAPADPGLATMRRIEVSGLDKRDLAELVFERTGRTLTPPQLERLYELSGGNPYYALELAATGDPELRVPESLSAVLGTRLRALSEPARSLGLSAATLGRFDETVIDGLHGAALAELRAAGIVDERTGSLRFAHPLLASALVEIHTPAERRSVHCSLAEALDDPDERAFHLGRGTEDPSEPVAEELDQAAARLDRRGAPETAAALMERAAALTPESDGEATTRRLILAADLHVAAGAGRERVLPILERLAVTLPPGPERARALVRLGWLGALLDTLTMNDAVVYQERALAEAEGSPEVVAAAHAVLARVRGVAGDYRAWLHHAELAFQAGAALESNAMFPSPFRELGFAKLLAGRGLDEKVFEQGIELESRLGRVVEPYQSAKLGLGLGLLYTGELDRAREVLLERLEFSVELGRSHSAAGCVLQLVELEVRAGNLSRAEAYAAEFVHLDRQLRGELSDEWYPSAIVAVHLGRVEDARRALSAGIEYCQAIGSGMWLVQQLWALGHLELSLGNLAAARDVLVPLAARLSEKGLGEWSVHPVHPDAIETLAGLGEIDEAAALTAELEEYGRRLDRPWGLATAARSEALIASARGAVEEALEAAERALSEHERLNWPFERARTLLVLGGILRRVGRRRDAAAALAEAREGFASVQSPLWLAKVVAEERRLGGRQSASGELTPTEERVAELAAQGLRNSEIAAQLYVTPKTVEATLSRVYRKVGVRSRTELARRFGVG